MASDKGKARPVKGILKHTSSLDKAGRREVEWDEMNILATHHPPDKDYGHMKIDEPPTPYNKCSDDEEGSERRSSFGGMKEPPLDPSQLASRLVAAGHSSKSATVTGDPESSSEDENETPEDRAARKDFELKRKLHYNEFAAVQLAKKLMEEDEDDEDENNSQMAVPPPSEGESNVRGESMEVGIAGPSADATTTCEEGGSQGKSGGSDLMAEPSMY